MHLEKRIIDLKNSGLSRAAAARELKMSKYQLQIMIDAMSLEWPKMSKPASYVIDGVLDTLAGHAARHKTTVGIIRYRLRTNKQIDAPKVPPVSRHEVLAFVDLRKDNVPAWKAAEQVGRPYNTLKNAAKKMVPEYEHIVAISTRMRRPANEIYGDNISKTG